MKQSLKYFNPFVHWAPILWIFLVIVGCGEVDKREEEIAKLDIELKISRFDREFMNATPDQIPELKANYPYLFPEQFNDSIWEAKMIDTLQIEISEEVDKAFGNFESEAEELESLFRHMKYYFPESQVPHVVTLTSDVRYDARVILTDTLLLLGLDNYLGEDHHFYRSIARYIAQVLDKKYLASDVASAFSKKVIKYPRNRTFLSRMVHYGKELYIKDKLLPTNTDAQKIGYTEEQMDWAQANEEEIWRYFVERELLYSTASDLDRRFLDPAPFSKFQLELDNESPGRLGRYVGWQIIRAFEARNPDVGLKALLAMPADEIFKKSNYKPKR